MHYVAVVRTKVSASVNECLAHFPILVNHARLEVSCLLRSYCPSH